MHTERPSRVDLTKGSDFKALYKKLERTLAGIERSHQTELLESVLRTLVVDFHEELGFRMGRLYRRIDSDYVLRSAHGGDRPAPIGRVVPRDYPPHVRTLAEGVLVMGRGEPGFDEAFERELGVGSTFAAIAVGPGNTHVLAFSVDGEIREERIFYSLSAIRHVINMKLEERKLQGLVEEARIIQESLLPSAAPPSPGYEIHGRSRPAETVGGDVYDFLVLPGGRIGAVIADSSGHGLPAALLARDVITGLRPEADQVPRVPRMVERLNRVIHRAALSSRFISLFYGVLRPDGVLRYTNAGHNPPLILRARSADSGISGEGTVPPGASSAAGSAGGSMAGPAARPASGPAAGSVAGSAPGPFATGGTARQAAAKARWLARGGLILGPDPQARYEGGRTRLAPGDLLALYTDGVVEQRSPGGEEFGTSRLRRLLAGKLDRPAREAVDAVFAAVDQFAEGEPTADDQTVVIIRRM